MELFPLGFVCEVWSEGEGCSVGQPPRPLETLHILCDHQFPRPSLHLVEESYSKEPFSAFHMDCGYFPSQYYISSVQVSHSVMSNSLQPMDCSTPGFPVHHQLPELAQTHVYWVSDAIQPSLSSVIPFSPCLQSFPASASFLISRLFTGACPYHCFDFRLLFCGTVTVYIYFVSSHPVCGTLLQQPGRII